MQRHRVGCIGWRYSEKSTRRHDADGGPALGRHIAQQIKRASGAPEAAVAVLLTLLELRPCVRHFIEQELPEMAVLSYQVLASDLRVNTLVSIQI